MEGTPNRTDTEAAGFLVEGRVQGVGFRWWIVRAARDLGVGGTVRNLPDGRVEVHASGPKEAVARLADLLEEGPPLARVERVVRIAARPHLPADFRVIG